MTVCDITVRVRHEPEHSRQTGDFAISIPENWHAEVVSGVHPCCVAGVDFYPCADARTRSEAVATLVDSLRDAGHKGNIHVLGHLELAKAR